jgi:glycosyltransferase involved in cell wall biosynthesis
MRLAFVTSLVPTLKSDTGFEIANAAIVQMLREAGHDVTCFGFVRKNADSAPIAQCVVIDAIDIENAVASPLLKLKWIAAALAYRLPIACAKIRLAAKGKLVAALKAHGPFDAIVMNAVMVPGALPELMDLAPPVLVEHNVEYRSAAQSAAHSGNKLMRWLYTRESRLLERIERAICDKARFVWFLAAEDQRMLGYENATKAAVLPLICGDQATQAQSSKAPPIHDIGLIGTWTWEPNRIGLSWFIAQVAPLLPTDISIALAGRLPDHARVEAANITYLGRVPDAGDFLNSCRTIALTSRAGTGVQLKTIEAFQLGKPAVATSLSLRGFTTIPANAIRADEPAEFAAQLTQLVRQSQAGLSGDADGSAFMAAQRARMFEVITAGLSHVSL